MDSISDLAILKIKQDSPKKWKKVKLASNQHLRCGDWVLAIGTPLGLQHTVTVGIVSSQSRKSHEIGGLETPVEFIQTDCVIRSGSSGGPLVNMDGEVIGVITNTVEGEGISFAIRIDNAKELIEQLLSQKKVTRPFLGVRMMSLTKSIKEQLPSHLIFDEYQKGVLITQVIPHSPASEAGLLEHDIILKIDDQRVTSTQEVLKNVGLRVGQTIKLTILRTVALEQDWDGRVMRYEVEILNLLITTGDLKHCEKIIK
jgi:serine protease Do